MTIVTENVVTVVALSPEALPRNESPLPLAKQFADGRELPFDLIFGINAY